MNKQNTYIVSDHQRQCFQPHPPQLEDPISKKLIISQGGEGGNALYNNYEVDQKKQKQVIQKEYDAKSIRYANEDYSYIANQLLSRFAQVESAAPASVQFPLFKMLRGVTKKFMFNELEIIFFLHTIEEQKWRYDDQLIQEFQPYFKQDFLSNSEIQNIEGYKKLLLFLVCCGYTIKCFFNDSNDQEILLINEHIQSYCQKDFKKFLDQWRQKYMNGSLKTVPRVVNKLYMKLMRLPRDGKQEQQQDYNALVDQIITISPPYSSQEGRQQQQQQQQIKQEIKPTTIVQQPQQQPIISFSQQTQQSFQGPYMGNSNIFMSNYSQQPPQPQLMQSYNNMFSSTYPIQDFLDPKYDDQIFNTKVKQDDSQLPPPPPLLTQSSNYQK